MCTGTEENIMYVLMIAHYGQQPPQNTMRRYHNWGKELVSRGYRVTIIAASTLHNKEFDYISELGTDHSECDGVEYLYVKTNQYHGNGLRRVRNMLSFCIGIGKYSYLEPDVIIISGAYLFGFAKRIFRKIPLITDTADLWPESIVQYTGISEYNPAIRIVYMLVKKAYINSSALIFSMEGGNEYLREQKYSNKIDYSKVFHINMGCDIPQKDKELEEVSFDLGWDMNDFNIVYCGSIRTANQVQKVCDAALIIKKRGDTNIAFRIYGNGDDLETLKIYVADNAIDNVHFYGRIEKEKIPYILSQGKANLLTYKNAPLWKYGGSQSKLFDYLASARPVICNVKFGYNLIERYNCGVVASDQSPEALADAIDTLYKKSPLELKEMGIRARKAAEMYDQPILVDELEKVFEYVSKNKND